MSRKRKSPRRKTPGLPTRLIQEFDRAIALEEAGRLQEARSVLVDLDRAFPGQPAILERLVDLHAALGDLRAYARACERLARRIGSTPDLLAGMAGGYMDRPTCGLAIARFRQFLAAAPQHEKAPEARRVLEEFLRVAPRVLQEMGLPPGDEGLELLALHEESLLLLEEEEAAGARRVLDQLLARCPTFQKALNNRAVLAFNEGRWSEALAASLRAIENAPEDFHAIGNRVRCLLFEGRPEEAREMARLMATQEGPEPDRPAKTAEALASVGEDAAVLEVVQRVRRPEPLVEYLGAIARARLGQEKAASTALRRLASRAGETAVGSLAADNLEDLEKPPGARNGPFYFRLTTWVSRGIRAFAASPSPKAARKLLAEHPELFGLAEVALDRGDAAFRTLVLALAEATRDERLLKALEPFARGRAGTDTHRTLAARLLAEEGRLPSRFSLYVEGSLREVILRQFQVTARSRYRHSAKVQRLVDDYQAALNRGDGQLAERLAREALSLEPDVPDLRNNMATLLTFQGRRREAAALVDELTRTHPEYPMPYVQRAMDHLAHRRVEQALDALDTVMDAPWLSINEFAALCLTSFEVELARRDPEAAESWLDRLDEVALDHPAIPEGRRRLAEARRRPLARR